MVHPQAPTMTGKNDNKFFKYVISPTPEDEKTKQQFSTVPWCKKLFEDKNYIQFKPQYAPTATFFRKTLLTQDNMTHWALFENTSKDIYEVKVIVWMGEGLNGHPNTAHGGFVCTLLDEIMGIVNNCVYKKSFMIMTAYLNVSFKKPTPTPGPLLCKSWIDKVDGRKRYTKGTIEDGNGIVFAEAEALFIEIKPLL